MLALLTLHLSSNRLLSSVAIALTIAYSGAAMVLRDRQSGTLLFLGIVRDPR